MLRYVDFQALDPKFHLAPEQKVMRLKGSTLEFEPPFMP